MRDIYRAFPSPLILGPCIVAIALTGPFGTFGDISFLSRFVFWGVAVIGCGVLFNGAILYLLMSKRLMTLSRLTKIALGCVIAGAPGALLLNFLDYGFRAHEISVGFLLWLWFCVTVVGLPISMLQYIWRVDPSYTQLQPTYSVPLLRRVEPHLQDRLISMSAQDHYVEVVTKKGKALLLMNFTDALAELDGYPGLRIHRSHWVANDAVVSLGGSGRSQIVVTTDGRSLPVSRAKLADVRTFLEDPVQAVN